MATISQYLIKAKTQIMHYKSKTWCFIATSTSQNLIQPLSSGGVQIKPYITNKNIMRYILITTPNLLIVDKKEIIESWYTPKTIRSYLFRDHIIFSVIKQTS